MYAGRPRRPTFREQVNEDRRQAQEERSKSRESRLPGWAQEALRDARTAQEAAELRAALVDEENTRLRDQLAGKAAARGTADTFLVDEDTGDELALGKGVTVRFTDFYDVRFKVAEAGLLVTADRDVAVQPVSPYEIWVKRV
jgi:hypothetical protein